MTPEPQYEIQTRQKGAWQRLYGGTSRWAMDKSWGTFCEVKRCAARYVERANGRSKIIATKKHRPHERRR